MTSPNGPNVQPSRIRHDYQNRIPPRTSESYTVKGRYADSLIKLYAKEYPSDLWLSLAVSHCYSSSVRLPSVRLLHHNRKVCRLHHRQHYSSRRKFSFCGTHRGIYGRIIFSAQYHPTNRFIPTRGDCPHPGNGDLNRRLWTAPDHSGNYRGHPPRNILGIGRLRSHGIFPHHQYGHTDRRADTSLRQRRRANAHLQHDAWWCIKYRTKIHRSTQCSKIR